MAVSRGGKILQADIDALAAAANAKANLEGKPYLFLPRRWIIKTPDVPARDFPPGWPNQGTSGVWDVASLKRLAGLQVGDVVINLKTGKFPFKCTALPTVNPDGSWTGGSWVDLRNNPGFGKPSWYIVNDFAQRDALGAVQDGSVCFIINNQPADLSVQGYFLEVRQGGQWKYYRGWSGELSRLRYAIGKKINVAQGPGFANPFRPPASAQVSERYIGSPKSGGPAWPTKDGVTPGTPNPDVSWGKSLEFYWTDPAQVAITRTIVLPWVHAGGTKTGFFAQITTGGVLSGFWSSSNFTLAPDDPANPAPLSADAFRPQLSGTLAGLVTQLSFTDDGGGLTRLRLKFAGNLAPAGDTFIQWNYAAPLGWHFTLPPDGKFYRAYLNDNLVLTTDFGAASAPAVGLHTKRAILKRDLRNEESFCGALTGANLPNEYYGFSAGGNFGTVAWSTSISGGDIYTRLLTSLRSIPIGVANSNGDGTEMDAYRVQFALKQFDYVPTAAGLVPPGQKGQFARTVATQSRGPNLFPNGPDLFPPQNHNPSQDNLPHACACKVYPVVFDPEGATGYAAFSATPGYGQVLRITAVRIPEEDSEGQAILPDNAVNVDVGCYRNGAFVSLATVTIPAGKNYGVWDRAADTPGIVIFEFYPLVVRCSAKVQVYPLWFNAAFSTGLGDGNLLEIPSPNFAPASFTAVCPPMMPDHYNETMATLALVT